MYLTYLRAHVQYGDPGRFHPTVRVGCERYSRGEDCDALLVFVSNLSFVFGRLHPVLSAVLTLGCYCSQSQRYRLRLRRGRLRLRPRLGLSRLRLARKTKNRTLATCTLRGREGMVIRWDGSAGFRTETSMSTLGRSSNLQSKAC